MGLLIVDLAFKFNKVVLILWDNSLKDYLLVSKKELNIPLLALASFNFPKASPNKSIAAV